MNREIKFRTWHKRNKKMIDVGEMDFNLQSIYYNMGNVSFDEFEIMQYTGLKDKNGKEIFEGDIIEAENRLWQIGFRDGCFVGVDFKNVAWDELVNIGYGETKVIGNVFEDSELLEVENGQH